MTSAKYHIHYGMFGLLMGAGLTYAGFADFEEVHNMFTLTDFRLLLAFAAAIAINVLGFYFIAKKSQTGKKKFSSGTVPGAVIFGVGWAITGACPSIALVQLGQGQLAAIATLLGILFGTFFYRKVVAGALKLDTGVCGE